MEARDFNSDAGLRDGMKMGKCRANLIRFILSYGSGCAACEAQSSDLSLGAIESASSSLRPAPYGNGSFSETKYIGFNLRGMSTSISDVSDSGLSRPRERAPREKLFSPRAPIRSEGDS